MKFLKIICFELDFVVVVVDSFFIRDESEEKKTFLRWRAIFYVLSKSIYRFNFISSFGKGRQVFVEFPQKLFLYINLPRAKW